MSSIARLALGDKFILRKKVEHFFQQTSSSTSSRWMGKPSSHSEQYWYVGKITENDTLTLREYWSEKFNVHYLYTKMIIKKLDINSVGFQN